MSDRPDIVFAPLGAETEPTCVILAGEELSRCVVQQYVYQRLMQEVQSRGYLVVDENRDQNGAIHMRIRHWEN